MWNPVDHWQDKFKPRWPWMKDFEFLIRQISGDQRDTEMLWFWGLFFEVMNDSKRYPTFGMIEFKEVEKEIERELGAVALFHSLWPVIGYLLHKRLKNHLGDYMMELWKKAVRQRPTKERNLQWQVQWQEEYSRWLHSFKDYDLEIKWGTGTDDKAQSRRVPSVLWALENIDVLDQQF